MFKIGDDKLHYEKFSDGSVVCIEDEIPFEIPESWAWCRLKNVALNRANAFVDGPFGSDLKVEHYTENREVRLIQLNNIGDGFWKDEVKKYTTFEHAEELLRCKTFSGDIVIAKMMPAGRSMIVPNIEKQYIISSDCVKLSAHDEISRNYITNMINSPAIRKIIQDDTQGIGRSRTSLGKLKELLIPLPPVDEQKRISETVETLLELVDSIESDKIDLSDLIKQTKAKVLDLAIKGKLVPQDTNDESADKLLEKIRDEKEKLIKEGKLKRDKNETFIFKNSDDNSYYEQIDGETVCIDDDLPFEIPDSWRIAKINSVAFVTKLAGFEYTKYIANNLCSEGVPLFKGKNIQDGEIIYKFEHYIPNEVSDNLARSQINKKCILLPYVGTIGNVAIHDKKGKFHLGSNVGKIELFNSLNINILEEYVLYFLRSSIGKAELKKHKKATAQDSISIDAIRDVNMLIPPIQEQYRIVEKIKSIFTQLDTMQEIFLQ